MKACSVQHAGSGRTKTHQQQGILAIPVSRCPSCWASAIDLSPFRSPHGGSLPFAFGRLPQQSLSTSTVGSTPLARRCAAFMRKRCTTFSYMLPAQQMIKAACACCGHRKGVGVRQGRGMQIEFRAAKPLLLVLLSSTLRNARGRRRFVAAQIATTVLRSPSSRVRRCWPSARHLCGRPRRLHTHQRCVASSPNPRGALRQHFCCSCTICKVLQEFVAPHRLCLAFRRCLDVIPDAWRNMYSSLLDPRIDAVVKKVTLIYLEYPQFLFQTRTQLLQRFLPVTIDCSSSVMASVAQQLPSPGACEPCLQALADWVTSRLKFVHDETAQSWWRWCRVPARAHPDNHGAGESAQPAAADRGRGGDAAQLGAGPQWPGTSRPVRQARDAKCGTHVQRVSECVRFRRI